jgi:copper chaperone
MKTEILNVSGMTCGGCTSKVTRALSSLPGVSKVDVSLAKNTAEITFDEGMTSVDGMRGALRSAGFDVTSTPATTTPGGCCS